MTEQDTLSEDIQDLLDELCEQGDEAMDENDPQEALLYFNRALELLPPPAENWEAFEWLQAAIGDARYAMGEHGVALEHFMAAYTNAGPEGLNPFVLLRMGQCFRRLGDDKKATEHLLRAYMLDGAGVFEGEADDFAFLKSAVPLDNPPSCS